MVQKTVLKVNISCTKCKKKLLKAVSSLEGVDNVEIDAAKETLTVTGNADPYEVIVRTRKASKFAEVVSIGPPPAPPKQDGQNKPEDKKKAEQKAQIPHHPYACPVRDRMAIVHVDRYHEPAMACSIM